MKPEGSTSGPSREDVFVTTRWTVVLAAGRKSSPDSDRALAELCQNYWYPLYVYVRRRGHSREDAEDLTQGFFTCFLEKNYLEGLAAERGKFRAFLLAALKHFLANQWNKTQRQKRGGGAQHLSLNWHSADERYHLDSASMDSPDKAYDREWAFALLQRVINRLKDECSVGGKAPLFERAHSYLSLGETAIPYHQAARELGMDEGAVRVAIHRLRKRYRQLLRDEIAQTLTDPGQVADELRSLQTALQ